uniref:AlNc14C92G5718 protein n=1 Tax=Albugo laibachii Nc14 TaxID=890382 RepID=F0WGI4_9STRA|nr:AlNc14C92G5718 [Albugo laibachii Nc14]|eukprot:CCA20348.1 AlNc14C92G5718 [Albugo laibachii Nc14]
MQRPRSNRLPKPSKEEHRNSRTAPSPCTVLPRNVMGRYNLQAKPSSLHFRFEYNRKYTKRVVLSNNSEHSVRFQYEIPKSIAFRLAFVDRKAFVSAGLCEELIVEFQLNDLKLTCVEDCIRVHCHEVSSKRAGKIDTIVVLLRASECGTKFPMIAPSAPTPSPNVPMAERSSEKLIDGMPSVTAARPQKQLGSSNVRHSSRQTRLKKVRDHNIAIKGGDSCPDPNSRPMSHAVPDTSVRSHDSSCQDETPISGKAEDVDGWMDDSKMQSEGVDECNEANKYFQFEGFPLVENETSSMDTCVLTLPNIDLRICPFVFLPKLEHEEALVMDNEAMADSKIPLYVPLMCHKRLRNGALDEIMPSVRLIGEQYIFGTPDSTSSLVDNFNTDVFLRPSRSLCPLLTCDSPRETDPWYLLRPRKDLALKAVAARPDDTPCFDSLRAYGADRPDESSLSPFIHETYRSYSSDSDPQTFFFDPNTAYSDLESFYQKTDPVACFSTTSNPFVELEAGIAFAICTESIINLSDSDSEDEENSPIEYQSIPTWQQACNLFENTLEHAEIGYGNPSVILPREYAHIALESQVRAKREHLRQRLPKRMEAVARILRENSSEQAETMNPFELYSVGSRKVHQASNCPKTLSN